MRRVEYLIDCCMDCPYYTLDGIIEYEKDLYDGHCMEKRIDIIYPEENNWFPDFCPLEKVED